MLSRKRDEWQFEDSCQPRWDSGMSLNIGEELIFGRSRCDGNRQHQLEHGGTPGLLADRTNGHSLSEAKKLASFLVIRNLTRIHKKV